MEFGLWIDIATTAENIYILFYYISYCISSFLFKWLLEILIVNSRTCVCIYKLYRREMSVYFFTFLYIYIYMKVKHLILFLEKWIMNFYGFNKCFNVYVYILILHKRLLDWVTYVTFLKIQKENIIDVNIIDLFLRF